MSREKSIVSVAGTLKSISHKHALVEKMLIFFQIFRDSGHLFSKLQLTKEDQDIAEFFQIQSFEL